MKPPGSSAFGQDRITGLGLSFLSVSNRETGLSTRRWWAIGGVRLWFSGEGQLAGESATPRSFSRYSMGTWGLGRAQWRAEKTSAGLWTSRKDIAEEVYKERPRSQCGVLLLSLSLRGERCILRGRSETQRAGSVGLKEKPWRFELSEGRAELEITGCPAWRSYTRPPLTKPETRPPTICRENRVRR